MKRLVLSSARLSSIPLSSGVASVRFTSWSSTSLLGAVVSGLMAAGCGAPTDGYGANIDGPRMPAPGTMPQGVQNAGSGGATSSNTTPNSNSGGGGSSDNGGVGVSADVLLDDFSDGDAVISAPGFAGNWATYSDGTSQVEPAVGATITPVDGAISVTGAGFDEWGVGLGVDLNNVGGQAQPADLSAYRGLGVRVRGSGEVAVELVIAATTGEEAGGTCAGEGCFGHYSATLVLGGAFEDQVLEFSRFSQPMWGQSTPLDLTQVTAINFLARAEGGPASIDLTIDSLSLVSAAGAAVSTDSGAVNPVASDFGSVSAVSDGTNPFAGRQLHSEGGQAFGAYNNAQGGDRELLGKIALNPSAFWISGEPTRAGSIVDGSGGNYAVIVAYNIPDRDCSGESAGGASSPDEYRGWIDAMSGSLQGKEAAIILEPDALALSCGEATESLIAYAVRSLRQNPGVAVYVDGGHSNWVGAGEMATRLRNAGIADATGFAVNVSNFQPTADLLNYGRALSAQVGGKPFVVDTSRNGQGARGDWCNPPGAGLGEAPTTNTGDPAAHAFLWVKRPGESDGACGQCSGVRAGQFCTDYALELARNSVF